MNTTKVICKTNNVTYGEVRVAMAKGAQNIEDLQNMNSACCQEDCCKKEVEAALNIICNCNNVRREKIIAAIKKGATTVEKVGQYTAAGTTCGRCKGIISAMIEKNS